MTAKNVVYIKIEKKGTLAYWPKDDPGWRGGHADMTALSVAALKECQPPWENRFVSEDPGEAPPRGKGKPGKDRAVTTAKPAAKSAPAASAPEPVPAAVPVPLPGRASVEKAGKPAAKPQTKPQSKPAASAGRTRQDGDRGQGSLF